MDLTENVHYMKCENCNKEIDHDSNFCKYCGAKVVKANVCSKCGAERLPKDAKFCPDCGASLVMKDESTIRQEAEKIVEKYPNGYRRYVIRGELPHFSSRVGLKNCEKIIAMEGKISAMEDTVEKERIKIHPKAKITDKKPDDFNVCTFVKSSVIPFWPKAGSGTLLSENNKYNLKNALKVISSKAKDSSMSELNKMRLAFVEQSLKAILDVSNGCTPYFRGIIQSCPVYSAFWESLRDECGENNCNKYWHYNSGTFADRLIDKMQSL